MNMGFSTRPAATRTEQAASPDQDTAPMATARLHADKLNPATVSGIVDQAPTAAATKDAPLGAPGAGRPVRAPTGTWHFDTIKMTDVALPGSDRPDVHLRKVIDIVATHAKTLHEVIPDLEVDSSLMLTGSVQAATAAMDECWDKLQIEIERGCAIGTVDIEIPSEAFRKVYRPGFTFPERPTPPPHSGLKPVQETS